MTRIFIGLLAGLIFGSGLVVSQMVDPRKVLAFLDVAGAWDPSLAFVMGGAVVVTFIGYRIVLGRAQPILATRFALPTRTDIDPQLVTGAAIFGAGWGLGGYCPGPAISAASLGGTPTLVFLVTMAVGMALARIVSGMGMRTVPA